MSHVCPARLHIDLGAVTANTAVLRERAGSAELMAVVKADGYGHGLVPAARACLAGGATWLGTAQLQEALDLRAAGLTRPRVLSWLHTPGADYAAALRADIDLAASGAWGVEAIAAAARRTGRTARVHLKVDTGLGRHGAFGAGIDDLLRRALSAQAEGVLEVVGVMSHFAYADAPGHPTVLAQQDLFRDVCERVQSAGAHLQVRHLANSAATLTNPGAAFDLVRPGLALYGLSPVPDVASAAEFGLRPAMRCEADVALVKDVPCGQGVSYGHAYVTEADTRLAILPIGYADGVPRAGTNVGPVRLGGRRHRIAGRVCMDQVVIDVGPGSEVEAGQTAVLFGDAARGEPTAQDWAEMTGTISYEIITRMSPRLPRVYRGEPGDREESS